MSATVSIPTRKRLVAALLAGYPVVFAEPTFRALFLVLLLAGSAGGMGISYTSVWANETFGAGPQAVAMLFVVSGLTGAIGSPLLGILSDRFGGRRPLIVGQLGVMAVAYLGYTQATSYSVALGLVAFSGLGIMGLVLAMVNDVARTMPESEQRNVARIIGVERSAWAMGIILGPAIAAAVVTVAGDTRPVFVAAALMQLIAMAVVFTVPERDSARSPAKVVEVPVGAVRRSKRTRSVATVALLAALALVTLPAHARNMYLPLFVTTVLGEPSGTVGPLFTFTAAIAVLAMPHVGTAADRFGVQRTLYLGAIVGGSYSLLQGFAASYLQTMAIQLLVGLGIALWSTSTIIYLQRLMPERVGAAGGLFVAVQQITPVLSGLLLGPIAQTSGIPVAFTTTAGLCAVALTLLVISHRLLAVR